MTTPDNRNRQDALKRLCNRVIVEYPDAMCMAVIELDCGCVNVCGVSVTGQPTGRVLSLSGSLDDQNTPGPICITCAGAGSPIMERVIHRELIWPGQDHEKPDRELRALIGRAVFGDAYEE